MPHKDELSMWGGCSATTSHKFVTTMQSMHTWDERWDMGPNMTKETDGILCVGHVIEILMRSPRDPVKLPFSQICHKPMHLDEYPGLDSSNAAYCHDEDISPQRTADACPLVPLIVAEGAPNPCGAKYRMLDGRHRICDLKRYHQHLKAAWFFVVSWDEVAALPQLRTSEGTVTATMSEAGVKMDRIVAGHVKDEHGRAYSEADIASTKDFLHRSRMRTLRTKEKSAQEQMDEMMAESLDKGFPQEVLDAYLGKDL